MAARRVEAHLEYVAVDIEVGVPLPGGVSDAEGRRNDLLQVAGYQGHLGEQALPEAVEREVALDDGNRTDVQWRLLGLEVEEGSVLCAKPPP